CRVLFGPAKPISDADTLLIDDGLCLAKTVEAFTAALQDEQGGIVEVPVGRNPHPKALGLVGDMLRRVGEAFSHKEILRLTVKWLRAGLPFLHGLKFWPPSTSLISAVRLATPAACRQVVHGSTRPTSRTQRNQGQAQPGTAVLTTAPSQRR